MRKAIGLILLFSTSGCWVGKDVCLSAYFDCEAGEACIEGHCMMPLPGGCVQEGAALQSPVPAAEQFGAAVSLDGVQLAVGDPKEMSTTDPGKAFVFSNVTQSQAAQDLTGGAPILQGMARFGKAVALKGNSLWVGAPENANSSGLVALFQSAGGNWMEGQRLVVTTSADAKFGSTLAADSMLFAGAPGDNFFEAFSGTSVMPQWPKTRDTPPPITELGSAVAVSGAWGAVSYVGGVRLFAIQPTPPTPITLPLAAGRTFDATKPLVALSNDNLLVNNLESGSSVAIWHHQFDGTQWTAGNQAFELPGSVNALALDGTLAAVGVKDGTDRVWALHLRSSSWISEELPKPSDTDFTNAADPRFGAAISVSRDLIAVGAPGVSGGRVYLYRCSTQ